MRAIDLILYALAAFCFFLSALPPVRDGYRLNLIALGLLLWVLVPLIALATTT
jgi:hypothetical protein